MVSRSTSEALWLRLYENCRGANRRKVVISLCWTCGHRHFELDYERNLLLDLQRDAPGAGAVCCEVSLRLTSVAAHVLPESWKRSFSQCRLQRRWSRRLSVSTVGARAIRPLWRTVSPLGWHSERCRRPDRTTQSSSVMGSCRVVICMI